MSHKLDPNKPDSLKLDSKMLDSKMPDTISHPAPKTPFPIITDPTLQDYCNTHSSKPSELLDQVLGSTEITGKLTMLSGQFLGQFLRMMSMALAPRYVLEVGTFTGYGSLCLLSGIAKDGQLHTIEKNQSYFELAQSNIKKSTANYKVHQHKGDAADIIASLDYEWDLVFVDAAKRQYSNYFELIMPNLRKGGVILADNVLWKGKVAHPENDKLGQGLDAFNKKVLEDTRVENVLLPIDDGVNFIIKL